MKVISLGNFDKKLFIILFIFLIISFLTDIIEQFYLYSSEYSINSINISLDIMFHFGLNTFFGIIEIIKRKGRYEVKKEKNNNNNQDNKIIYIFTDLKKMKWKRIIFLFLIVVFYLLYLYVLQIYLAFNYEKDFLLEGEGTKAFEISFFLLLSRIMDKSEFYRHQYAPMIIMISMGLIRFVISLIINNTFNFPDDLLYLFFGLIISLIESSFFFILQRYMKYKYYSPFLICFIIGAFFLVIPLILLLSFMNVDCGNTGICGILSEPIIIKEKLTIVILVINSLLYTFFLFIEILTIHYFSVFHLILFICFGKLFNIFFFLSSYNIYEIVTIIFTLLVDIISVSVFVEILILNFCGFNKNIKKYITFRAEDEIDHLLEIDSHDGDDSINDHNNNGRDDSISSMY